MERTLMIRTAAEAAHRREMPRAIPADVCASFLFVTNAVEIEGEAPLMVWAEAVDD